VTVASHQTKLHAHRTSAAERLEQALSRTVSALDKGTLHELIKGLRAQEGVVSPVYIRGYAAFAGVHPLMTSLLASKIAASFDNELGCLLRDFGRVARRIQQVLPATKKALANSRRAIKQSHRKLSANASKLAQIDAADKTLDRRVLSKEESGAFSLVVAREVAPEAYKQSLVAQREELLGRRTQLVSDILMFQFHQRKSGKLLKGLYGDRAHVLFKGPSALWTKGLKKASFARQQRDVQQQREERAAQFKTRAGQLFHACLLLTVHAYAEQLKEADIRPRELPLESRFVHDPAHSCAGRPTFKLRTMHVSTRRRRSDGDGEQTVAMDEATPPSAAVRATASHLQHVAGHLEATSIFQAAPSGAQQPALTDDSSDARAHKKQRRDDPPAAAAGALEEAKQETAPRPPMREEEAELPPGTTLVQPGAHGSIADPLADPRTPAGQAFLAQERQQHALAFAAQLPPTMAPVQLPGGFQVQPKESVPPRTPFGASAPRQDSS
jgi:hypothetical protein